MTDLPPVRDFVLSQVAEQLAVLGLQADELPDDFDLIAAGALDSLGLVELMGAVEANYGTELDFERLDADSFGVVGPFCSYIEGQVRDKGFAG